MKPDKFLYRMIVITNCSEELANRNVLATYFMNNLRASGIVHSSVGNFVYSFNVCRVS